ncbi:MAG: hypothetical protein ACJARE_003171, partial [Paracoccaceae bacterium]
MPLTLPARLAMPFVIALLLVMALELLARISG